MNPIELTVIPHPHDGSPDYMVCWPDDELGLSQGYNPRRLLIVRLQRADYQHLLAPLGTAAAMPKVNATAPVSQATQSIFHRSQHGG